MAKEYYHDSQKWGFLIDSARDSAKDSGCEGLDTGGVEFFLKMPIFTFRESQDRALLDRERR